LIGRRSFAYDAAKIDAYIGEEMRWWRGERETRGVKVEEAYKCRICEFAEGCVWRATKVVEGFRKARLRGEEQLRSVV
jgi:exonuclease V